MKIIDSQVYISEKDAIDALIFSSPHENINKKQYYHCDLEIIKSVSRSVLTSEPEEIMLSKGW